MVFIDKHVWLLTCTRQVRVNNLISLLWLQEMCDDLI